MAAYVVLGVAIFALAVICAGGSFNTMREPRKRGLFSRLVLGNPLTGLAEIWRRDGAGGFFFGERRR